MSTRVDWIDECKGMLLLLVCIFHVEQSFLHVQMGMLHLALCRMTAFFFISGVLFSTRRFSCFKDYFVHKTKVLLLPYVYLSLLFLLLDPVVYDFNLYEHAPKMSIMTMRPVIENSLEYAGFNLAKIFLAGKSSIGSGPLWFVFTLYSVSLIFYLAKSLFKGQKTLLFIFSVVCSAAGFLLYKNHIRLPFGIERNFTVLFFFSCGFLCKDFIKKLNANMQSKKYIGSVFILAIVSILLYAYFEVPDKNFSIMNNDLGKSYWRFIASSVCGITGILFLFLLFSKIPAKLPVLICKRILKAVSVNALVMLALHWWILLILRLYFKEALDKEGIAYISFFIVCFFTVLFIPLFRCKLYFLLGKKKATLQDCFYNKP